MCRGFGLPPPTARERSDVDFLVGFDPDAVDRFDPYFGSKEELDLPLTYNEGAAAGGVAEV